MQLQAANLAAWAAAIGLVVCTACHYIAAESAHFDSRFVLSIALNIALIKACTKISANVRCLKYRIKYFAKAGLPQKAPPGEKKPDHAIHATRPSGHAPVGQSEEMPTLPA
jgi:hypothetical protein